MGQALEQYEAAKQRVEQARKDMQAVAKDVFAELSKSFFDQFPSVKQMSWTQYTPWFNDGDECVFGVNDVELLGVNESGDEEDERCRWSNKYKGFPLPDEAYEVAEKLQGTLSKDDLRDMFGNHVQVIVTREGVDVETYDHD